MHHLLCEVECFEDELDLVCKRVVSSSCVAAASPGAAALGFMASIAAACSGPMNATHWLIASDKFVGASCRVAVCGREGVALKLDPMGKVISLHVASKAILTHLVIEELALIITFPSVVAIPHLVA